MGTPDQLGHDIALLTSDLAKKHIALPTGVVPQVINGLTIGEDGRILRAVAGSISAGGTAYFARSGNQSVNNITFSRIIFNSTVFCDTALYALDTGTGIVTFNVTGHYLTIARIQWASNATGIRIIETNQYGSATPLIGNDIKTAVSGFNTPVTAVGFASMVAGDTFDVNGYQNSGGNLSAGSGEGYTNLFIMQIG